MRRIRRAARVASIMRRLLLLALPAVLALPAAAQAAPVKLSPTAKPVSAAGVTSIEAANPNRYAMRGTATVTVAGRKIAARSVRLPKRSVTPIRLSVGADGVEALRAAGGKATVALRAGKRGARKSTARRTLTLRLPAAPAPGPAAPAPEAQQPAAPAQTHYLGRLGNEGAYDDFELDLTGGNQFQLSKPALLPVSCGEIGGLNRIAVSSELFDAAGPWTVGADGAVEKQGLSVNSIVSGGSRTITYTVKNTSMDATHIVGTFGMSFSDSRYDVFSNSISFTNCAGTQSWEAIPAP
jgi:hypothetical protein